MLQKLLDRFKVSTKLYFLVFILCSTIIAIAAYGLFQMHRMDASTQDLYNNRVVCMEQLVNVRHAYAKNIVFALQELKDGTTSYHEAEKRMDNANEEIITNWGAYKRTYLTPEEAKLAAEAEIMMHQADSAITDERAILDKSDTSNFSDLHPVKLFNITYALVEKLNELLKLQVTVSKDIIENSNLRYRATVKKFYLLTFTVLVFGILLFLAILFDTKRLIENLLFSNKKISESEEKYHYLFANSPAFNIIWDPENLKVLEVSNSVLEKYGYSKEEWQNMSLLQIRPNEDYDKITEFAKKMLNEDTHVSYGRWRHITKNGEELIMAISSHKIFYNGKSAVLSLARDVTEQMKVELELKKNEEKNKAVIENISDAIFLMDEKTVSSYHSPSVRRIFGYSFAETQGDTVFKYIHPDEIEEAHKLFTAIATNPGTTFQSQFRVRHKNGNYIWVEGTATNLLNKENVKAIILNCRDITERKNAEIEILQLNRLYLFISEINESMLRLDSSEEIFSQACRIAVEVGGFRMAWIGEYHESNDQIIPITWAGHEDGFFDAVKVPEMKVSTSSIPSARAIRMKTHFYYDNIANDINIPDDLKQEMLKRKYLSGISLPIFVDSKIVAAIVLLMSETFFFNEQEVKLLREVTDNITYALDKIRIRNLQDAAEKEVVSLNESLEKKVVERTAQLNEANKELESFSYSVSHDLRTPLTIIHGYAQVLLQEEGKFDVDTLAMLKAVMGSAEKMADLIDDILALSRAVKTEAKITKLDMAEIAKEAFTELEKSMSGSVKANITINPLLPCYADHNLIVQVFTNLISNAIKYSGQKEKPEIEVGSYQKDNECIYFVKDNGAGFDMKNYDKLFGVFQRLHSSREFEGTGVGLALVKRIITKHSGRVWAEAEPGKGATFYFSLPNITQ